LEHDVLLPIDVHLVPVGLHEDTFMLAATREQQRVHLSIAADKAGVKHRQHTLARHSVRECDRAPRHALGAEFEHPLPLRANTRSGRSQADGL
jgi:hypothetical protein